MTMACMIMYTPHTCLNVLLPESSDARKMDTPTSCQNRTFARYENVMLRKHDIGMLDLCGRDRYRKQVGDSEV